LTTGIDEAIDLLMPRIEGVCVVRPGFDGYALRAEAFGRRVQSIRLDGSWQPALDPTKLDRTAVLAVARPGNPTGNLISEEWLRTASRYARLTLIDETYLDFCDEPSAAPTIECNDRMVIFKSFSKVFGLAGLRVGALIGSAAMIATLRQQQRFKSVDTIALHGALAALNDSEYFARLRQHVDEMRPVYVSALADRHILAEVRVTLANFVLVRTVPDYPGVKLVKALAKAGVLVADCETFGLPGWIRISIGTQNDLDGLIAALESA
jgi:histidinol-phosphate aminotransferase